MGTWRPTRCKNDARHVGPYSRRGLCRECAIEKQTFVAVELHNKSGPNYDRWVESMRKVADSLDSPAT